MARRLAVLVAVAALAGCGGVSDAGSSTDTSSGSQGAEVLRFSAPIVGGGELDGSTLTGRPVAFWFWAPT